jgi:transcription initiation factor IIF auxiliary subunit
MNFKIEQDYQYQGNDWWKWAVWVNGTDSDLKEIDHVVYTLHPTFPEPVRVVKTRSNKFKLKTGGWGNFRIHATVFPKNGDAIPLKHDLILRYPDQTPAKR